MEPWLFYALLSAVSAAFVSIFGKVGLQGIDSNVATAVRAVIMAVFLIGVVFVQGNFSHLADVLQDKKGLLFVALSGIAGATSWLFTSSHSSTAPSPKSHRSTSSASSSPSFSPSSCSARKSASSTPAPSR